MRESEVLERLDIITCYGIEGNNSTRHMVPKQYWQRSFESNIVAYRIIRNKAVTMGIDVSGSDQRVFEATEDYARYSGENNIAIVSEGVEAKYDRHLEGSLI